MQFETIIEISVCMTISPILPRIPISNWSAFIDCNNWCSIVFNFGCDFVEIPLLKNKSPGKNSPKLDKLVNVFT